MDTSMGERASRWMELFPSLIFKSDYAQRAIQQNIFNARFLLQTFAESLWHANHAFGRQTHLRVAFHAELACGLRYKYREPNSIEILRAYDESGSVKIAGPPLSKVRRIRTASVPISVDAIIAFLVGRIGAREFS